MNYEETISYLYNRLPMFQRIGSAAYKADLSKTLELARFFGNPERSLRFIHIAGTNGKGSVSHMVASICQAKGIKTGLYTSPHLKDFRERIKVDGKMIPRSWVSEFVRYFKKDIDQMAPSFFELTFIMALRYFKSVDTELVILETGMGGRLDSTNIVHPLISVITNISLDHMVYLGDHEELIATEKAGIIKPQVPVVIGRRQSKTDEIFEYKAEMEDAPLSYAEDRYTAENISFAGAQKGKLQMDIYRSGHLYLKNLRCPLTGLYQRENIITVMQVTEEMIRMGYDIRKHHQMKGINDVVKQTGLSGRYQQLGTHPLKICDTAHNPDGLKQVMEQLHHENFEKMHIVFGVVNDKDLKPILRLLPPRALYYFCKADIPRGMDAIELQMAAMKYHLHGSVYATVKEAWNAALSNASERDLIFAGGSTFTVAEVL